MIKETIIRMGALIQCSLKGKLIRRGDYSKEGRGSVLIRAFAIFQLSLELFHSVPGVPYLFVLLYLDSFFIDSSPQFLLIIHRFA